MVIGAEDLHALIVDILTRAGASQTNAECVASHLVGANLCGVDTHGVWQLPGYVAAIERGELVPKAVPFLLIDTQTAALITGNWGFGQVAAIEATQQAVRKAQHCGVAVVSVVQSHHIGRLGAYAELIARQRLITIIWASGLGENKPAVVPYGGRKAVFGTNPIAIGLPTGDESPIVIDFATSTVSAVKVIDAARKRDLVPPGWIVDQNGRDTTDPRGIGEKGGLAPFGGHKGYGLMLAIEVLGRIFAGADAFVEPPRGGDFFSHQGATMVVVRADLFQPLNDYSELTCELRERLRAVPPDVGETCCIDVPGEPEARVRAVREHEGIPLPDDLWETLAALKAHAPASALAVRSATETGLKV